MYAFNDKSLVCAQEIEEAINSKIGGEINLYPIMTRCAMDIICGNYLIKLTNFYFSFEIIMTIQLTEMVKKKETAMGGKTLNDEDKGNYMENFHGLVKHILIHLLMYCRTVYI